MLLTSVILVLREVLEAALLISILSALSVVHGIGRRWIVWALIAGCLCAAGMAAGIDSVTDWFDGVGQEVTSAGMQFAIYLVVALLLWQLGASRFRRSTAAVLMALVIVLAVTREGFEVLVYLSGFTADVEIMLTVLIGAAVGAAIGISIGALFYYLLAGLSGRSSYIACLVLLVLVSAGLASQASLLLIQADWLPAQLPLWDSSGLIAEQSMAGQLLYALIGYEATPTPIQAGFYFGSGLFILLVGIAASLRRNPDRATVGDAVT